MKVNSYKELQVWQKAILLVSEIYKITNQLPKYEIYILVSQMLRSAISVPSNIAEGYRRNSRAEFIRFLSIAIASAAELETQLIITKRQYTNVDCGASEFLVDEIQRMLYAMINSLNRKNLDSTLNAAR